MKTTLKVTYALFVLLCLCFIQCSKTPDTPVTPTPTSPTALTIASVTPLSGPVGTKVIISGSGFKTAPADNIVKFGNTVAKVDSASTSRLVTKVPPGAQTAKISVQVSGTTVSHSSNFVVTTITSPIIASNTTFYDRNSRHKVLEIATTSAKVSSLLDGANSGKVLQHGHVWTKKNSSIPTLSDSKTELGIVPTTSETYSFTSTLSLSLPPLLSQL